MSQPTPAIDRHTVHALRTLQQRPATSITERWKQAEQTSANPVTTAPGEIGN